MLHEHSTVEVQQPSAQQRAGAAEVGRWKFVPKTLLSPDVCASPTRVRFAAENERLLLVPFGGRARLSSRHGHCKAQRLRTVLNLASLKLQMGQS